MATARAVGDAPLDYFMHTAGPAAQPTMVLGWVFAAVAVAVSTIIAVLLVAAIVRRRTRADAAALGPEGGGMRWIYVGTGLSVLALFAMLVYMLVTLQSVAAPPRAAALTVAVTAYDWWWKIDYPPAPGENGAPAFATANEIHIPVGEPVRIELRSADVIHTFWAPQLAGKTQAIPGQTNTQWMQADAPGVYRGQCSQFCGAQHAHMAFEVIAQPRAEFDAWRAAQARDASAPSDVSARAGQRIFRDRCAGCHTVRGGDAAGVQGPDLTHLRSRRLIAAGTLENTASNQLDWIEHAQRIKPDSLMPGIALDAHDAAALSAYLVTLE